MLGNAGMEIPDVMIVQSIKGIACFWCALRVNGQSLAVLDRWGLFSVLQNFGHFRFLCEGGIVFVVATGVCAMVLEAVDDGEVGENGLFMLVNGDDTVGAWTLLGMTIMGLVRLGMELVGSEH